MYDVWCVVCVYVDVACMCMCMCMMCDKVCVYLTCGVCVYDMWRVYDVWSVSVWGVCVCMILMCVLCE